jgi:GNAT superfamily N-acetyltransferase
MKMEKSILNSVWEEYEKIFLHPSTFLNERNVEELMKDYSEGMLELVVLGSKFARGFCMFYRDSPYSYFIDYLGVREEDQGRGLGKCILDFTLSTIRIKNPEIETIGLLCKDDKVTFYKKNGFVLESSVLINDQLWNKMVNKNV